LYLEPVRIVSMCGSLGSTSANRLALDLAIDRLKSEGSTDSVVDVPLRNVPMFDPDRVDEPPTAVAHMRSVLEAADGVLLAAPEYAGGLAGSAPSASTRRVRRSNRGSASSTQRPCGTSSTGCTNLSQRYR